MVGHLTRQHYYRSCGLSHILLSRCYVQERLSPTRCGARSTCKYRVTQADSVCKSFFMALCRFVKDIQKRCCVFVQYVEWCLVWCRCCLAVLCAVVWCGSVTRCKALLRRFYGFMVYGGLIALKGCMRLVVRLAGCHAVGMVSAVWCLCLWCGAVACCVALLALLWLWVLSGLAVCLWLSLWLFWCAVRGAVSLVLSCCLVLVSSLVFWSGLLVYGHSVHNT